LAARKLLGFVARKLLEFVARKQLHGIGRWHLLGFLALRGQTRRGGGVKKMHSASMSTHAFST
jgi:hypothetical protein